MRNLLFVTSLNPGTSLTSWKANRNNCKDHTWLSSSLLLWKSCTRHCLSPSGRRIGISPGRIWPAPSKCLPLVDFCRWVVCWAADGVGEGATAVAGRAAWGVSSCCWGVPGLPVVTEAPDTLRCRLGSGEGTALRLWLESVSPAHSEARSSSGRRFFFFFLPLVSSSACHINTYVR